MIFATPTAACRSRDDARREWILNRQNTEMRARLPVTPYDELGLDWDCMMAERARRIVAGIAL